MNKSPEETKSLSSPNPDPAAVGRWHRAWPWIRSAITASVFLAAFWLLFHEFKSVQLQDVFDSFHLLPYQVVFAALLLTAVNYVIMIGYDWPGVKLVHHPVRLGQIATASTLSFAFGIGLAQALVAGFDFLFAAATLFVLLPQSLEIGFFQFTSIYLLAIILALISNVPGGLGVLELVLITMLRTNSHSLVASLLAYRVIYYLLPLLLARIGLGTGTVLELLLKWRNGRK